MVYDVRHYIVNDITVKNEFSLTISPVVFLREKKKGLELNLVLRNTQYENSF